MWISSSTLPAWVSWCLCCTAQAGCPPMPLASSGSPAALGSTWQNTFSLCYPFLSKYLPGSPRGRAELWVLLRKTFLEGSSHPIPVTMHDKYLCQTLLTASLSVLSVSRELALSPSHLCDISGSLHCQPSDSECPMTVTATTLCYLTGSTSSASMMTMTEIKAQCLSDNSMRAPVHVGVGLSLISGNGGYQ